MPRHGILTSSLGPPTQRCANTDDEPDEISSALPSPTCGATYGLPYLTALSRVLRLSEGSGHIAVGVLCGATLSNGTSGGPWTVRRCSWTAMVTRTGVELQIGGGGDPRAHILRAPEIAVVSAPALRRCWWATRGGGAFESSWPREAAETVRLEVSSTSVLADARLAALDDTSRARLPPTAPRAPATSLPLVELVRGEIDAFLIPCPGGLTGDRFGYLRPAVPACLSGSGDPRLIRGRSRRRAPQGRGAGRRPHSPRGGRPSRCRGSSASLVTGPAARQGDLADRRLVALGDLLQRAPGFGRGSGSAPTAERPSSPARTGRPATPTAVAGL